MTRENMTREKALKIVKEFINGTCLHTVDQEALETLLPELKESEDERIRKDLIRLIRWAKENNTPSKYYTDRYDTMLAWLEKQKGSKEYVFRPLAGTDITIAAEQAIRRANEGDHLVLAFNGAYIRVRKGNNAKEIVDIYDAFIEKQKEQKYYWKPTETDVALFNKAVTTNKALTPAERAQLDIIRSKFGCCRAVHCNGIVQEEQKPSDLEKSLTAELQKIISDWQRTGANPYDSVDAVAGDVDAILDIARKEQKPAEWSEEDKDKLYQIIETLLADKEVARRENPQHYDALCKAYDELISWLKSLRPQPQKELSIEKAIKWLDDTFYSFDNSSGRGRYCEIITHDFDSLEEMYDSFRKAVIVDSEPHWKPSKEQMDALKNSVEHIPSAYYNDMWELYEQLKKL